MQIKWPWSNATTETRQPQQLEQRGYNSTVGAEKVFIERDGLDQSYSFQAPPMLESSALDALNRFAPGQNFIDLFECLPEVFAPVHEIAKRVAGGTFQLVRSWNDEVDYNDADFNRLFSQPNPLHSFRDFVYNAVCYEILTGKQFFYKNQPDTLPDEYKSVLTWSNLPSPAIKAVMRQDVDPWSATDMSDFVVEYRMPTRNGYRVFPTNKVLPLLNLSLKDGVNLNNVVAPIKGAEKPIANLIPVYQARGVIYVKRGMMGLLVSKKSDDSGMVSLTKGEKQEIQDEYDQMYGLEYRKSQIGIGSAPVDFVKTSMSIQELEPFEETLADAVAIYAVLRVPRHLVPSKDQSTFNNTKEEMKAFYSDVIVPWGERLAEAWTNFFGLKDFRRYIRADYSHVDVLQENKKDKAGVEEIMGKVWFQRWTSGVCTLNDWIVSTGANKVTGNPLYELKLFEMTPEQVDQVKTVLSMKAAAKPDPNADPNNNDNQPPDKGAKK